MSASIRATGGALGAEVEIDLSRDPAPEVVHSILRAFERHHVLLFRGQSLSESWLLEVSGWFGPVYRPPPGFPMLGGAEQPAIVKLANTAEGGVAGRGALPMHSDLHNMPCPADASLLYALEVPETGGETSWSNLQQAYDELDAPLRSRLAGVRASSPNPYAGGEEALARDAAGPNQLYVEGSLGRFPHPVVRTHPTSGRKALFVGHYVDRLHGLSHESEAPALLEALKRHVDRPHLYWTHRWRAGDLVISDNRCTNHRRAPFTADARRTLWRMMLGGSRPF